MQKKRELSPRSLLTFISVGDEEELTKETEISATEEENQESVMSWKSSGGKECLQGGSDQQKPSDESFPREKE